MTLPIILTLLLLGLVLVAFIFEWQPPDLIGLSILAILLILACLPWETVQLAPVSELLGVFNNGAPLTIGAMFILSAALQRTGAIDALSRFLGHHLSSQLRVILLAVGSVAALCSAFMNNTPIVAIFMPVMLSLARDKNIPISKLLLPLSYAAVMGGCCTLIGTSTNILVSGVAERAGLAPIGMFELTSLGFIFLTVGLVYLVVLGPWLLPARETVSSVLSDEARKRFLCQILIKPDSPLVGAKLLDTPLARSAMDFHIIEVRRQGTRLLTPLNEIVVEPYDRILLSAPSRMIVELPKVKGIALSGEAQGELGIENLSTIEGGIVEGIISPHSRLVGKSIRQINFRQTYGMLILAVHRHGKNLSRNFENIRLRFGDTLLMLGPLSTFAQLREDGDFMLMEDKLPEASRSGKAWMAWTAIATVVVVAALEWMPIAAIAIIGALGVMLVRCIDPDEAYRAIDWQILFMLYGMLGLGVAMEHSGTASFLANSGLSFFSGLIPSSWLPYVVLAFFYLLTSTMTEVLSNNATAVVITPIAISAAAVLNVDPRPLVICVCFAASAAFATPVGYQTHMMVYGPGGYKFTDFLRVGIPLNLIFWVIATFLIPFFWPFYPSH